MKVTLSLSKIALECKTFQNPVTSVQTSASVFNPNVVASFHSYRETLESASRNQTAYKVKQRELREIKIAYNETWTTLA